MHLSSKILPALALVAALAPMAANAAPALAPLQHASVMPSGATIDAPAIVCSSGHPRMFLMQPAPTKYDVAPLHHASVMPSGATIDRPTAIYTTGTPAPLFPISEGG